MCEEAGRYEEKASRVRLELTEEWSGSPYSKILERAHAVALAGAQKARLAHQLGKCSCFAKAAVEVRRRSHPPKEADYREITPDTPDRLRA
jgi:hypothetical protein